MFNNFQKSGQWLDAWSKAGTSKYPDSEDVEDNFFCPLLLPYPSECPKKYFAFFKLSHETKEDELKLQDIRLSITLTNGTVWYRCVTTLDAIMPIKIRCNAQKYTNMITALFLDQSSEDCQYDYEFEDNVLNVSVCRDGASIHVAKMDFRLETRPITSSLLVRLCELSELRTQQLQNYNDLKMENQQLSSIVTNLAMRTHRMKEELLESFAVLLEAKKERIRELQLQLQMYEEKSFDEVEQPSLLAEFQAKHPTLGVRHVTAPSESIPEDVPDIQENPDVDFLLKSITAIPSKPIRGVRKRVITTPKTTKSEDPTTSSTSSTTTSSSTTISSSTSSKLQTIVEEVPIGSQSTIPASKSVNIEELLE